MFFKSSPPVATPAPRETKVERPSLSHLLLALIDARVSHVDIMDTEGEAELERYYRARHAAQKSGPCRFRRSLSPARPSHLELTAAVPGRYNSWACDFTG